MIENWADPGMPPEEYDVLDKVYVFRPDSNSHDIYAWLRNVYPHKGTVIHGFTGEETFVQFYCYPGIKPQLVKNQHAVEGNHPLHGVLEERYRNKAEEIPIFNG